MQTLLAVALTLREKLLMTLSLKEKFIQEAQELAPGFRLRQKSKSFWMKVLGVLVKPFCPTFMTDFATAIGKTVYLPDDLWVSESRETIILLAHELRHVTDRQQRGSLWYALAYLFPQILALLSLLSLVSIWDGKPWLLFLCCLVFLAPIPAFGRTDIEKRGYTISLLGYLWVYGTADDMIGWAARQFTSSNYYFMWPFEKSLKEDFTAKLRAVKSSMDSGIRLELVLDEVEGFFYDFIKTNKLDATASERGSNV